MLGPGGTEEVGWSTGGRICIICVNHQCLLSLYAHSSLNSEKEQVGFHNWKNFQLLHNRERIEYNFCSKALAVLRKSKWQANLLKCWFIFCSPFSSKKLAKSLVALCLKGFYLAESGRQLSGKQLFWRPSLQGVQERKKKWAECIRGLNWMRQLPLTRRERWTSVGFSSTECQHPALWSGSGFQRELMR